MSSTETKKKEEEEVSASWTTDPKYKDILVWFTSHHTGRFKDYFHFEPAAVVPSCTWRRDGSALQLRFRKDGTFGLYVQLRRTHHCFFQDIDDVKTKEEAMERVAEAAMKLLTTTDEMTTAIISKSEASASLVELCKSILLDPK